MIKLVDFSLFWLFISYKNHCSQGHSSDVYTLHKSWFFPHRVSFQQVVKLYIIWAEIKDTRKVVLLSSLLIICWPLRSIHWFFAHWCFSTNHLMMSCIIIHRLLLLYYLCNLTLAGFFMHVAAVEDLTTSSTTECLCKSTVVPQWVENVYITGVCSQRPSWKHATPY